MRERGRVVTRADAGTRVLLDPANIWRIGWVVIGLIVLVLVLEFILGRGRSLIFLIVMAWFGSLAIEPAVSRLANRMPRGAATGVVMGGVVAFLVLFFSLFGQLIVDQVAHLVQSVPDLARDGLDWANQQLGTDYTVDQLVSNMELTSEKAAGLASQLAGGVLAVLGSIAGFVASTFMFALFLFYLSADGPRLRRWIASLFPPRAQETTVVIWDTMAEKTGRYVGARVILAAVNATLSGIVFLVIGLPSWLALALWTGLIALFLWRGASASIEVARFRRRAAAVDLASITRYAAVAPAGASVADIVRSGAAEPTGNGHVVDVVLVDEQERREASVLPLLQQRLRPEGQVDPARSH